MKRPWLCGLLTFSTVLQTGNVLAQWVSLFYQKKNALMHCTFVKVFVATMVLHGTLEILLLQ